MNSRTKAVTDVQAILDRIDDYSLPPEQYLTRRYGRMAWRFDPYCNCYIVADEEHAGPGRSYVIVERDLRSERVTVAETQIN